jgi:hypothetical protein
MLASAISQNTRGMLKTIGRTWLTIAGVSFLLIYASGSILWWQGQLSTTTRPSAGERRTVDEAERANVGRDISGGPQRTFSGACGDEGVRTGR